ncbi:MAG TPA: di-heme oxidoredictase family protein, partial [Nitrospiraceae bacterium]|nr:di-heme oxidoredictase family protein [Nitrospiraceae bacterium]
KSSIEALRNKEVKLYSDLMVHNMGQGLADDVSQGNAGGDEFRTAPLWGLGQRIFFLHDGRTNDLLQAVQAHAGLGGRYVPSEANQVIGQFNRLSEIDKQHLLNFLRSL